MAFGASNWLQLSIVGTVVAVAIWLTAPQSGAVWHLCWMLRWLLIFTLLMHLLFSPGRTLWGTTWLSYDGFLTGCMVCVQVILALATSAMLNMTTSSEDLVRAFAWFVQPLQRLGWQTQDWQKLLLLTLEFIPAIKEELHTAGGPGTNPVEAWSSRTGMDRWSEWIRKFSGLIWRLVDRGDAMAKHLASDEAPFIPQLPLPSFLPMSYNDQIISSVMTFMILCFWMLG
jgi:energy-coupling factor transport system permease protein